MIKEIMKLKITSLFLFVVMLLSCNNDNNFGRELTNSNTVIINDNLFANVFDNELEIRLANITQNNLNITIDYGGGCGEIFYDLVTDNAYEESNPPRKILKLAFEDNDNCEALIELNLSFDLSPLKISDSNRIIIILEGWSSQLEYNY